MFKGFVYNQIWEDPDVDLEALGLGPRHQVPTIASGGCNILNYLAADPERIIAVDLNSNHAALRRLKLAALANLPGCEEFFRFFGRANDKSNRSAFDTFLSHRLDPETRRYWEKHVPLHGRRINMFAHNLYRYGLLGRFIGILHAVARLHGKRLEAIVQARTRDEQRVRHRAKPHRLGEAISGCAFVRPRCFRADARNGGQSGLAGRPIGAHRTGTGLRRIPVAGDVRPIPRLRSGGIFLQPLDDSRLAPGSCRGRAGACSRGAAAHRGFRRFCRAGGFGAAGLRLWLRHFRVEPRSDTLRALEQAQRGPDDEFWIAPGRYAFLSRSSCYPGC